METARRSYGRTMTSTTSLLERLDASKYVLVTSFRRDGTPVSTPVWAARDDDSLVVWTGTGTGKVKRIRRDGTVAVAPCSARGKPYGDSVPARAEILDAAGTTRTRELIKKKYGLVGRLLVNGSLWRRGATGTVGVRITLGPADAEPHDPGGGTAA
jgi:PPOX class probable F420-dependent enzyme